MKIGHVLMIVGVTAGLAGCMSAPNGGIVTRSVVETGDLLVAEEPALAENWHVVAVNVQVPESLRVSEANTYKPVADIVWREDPIGDRRAQVKAIVQNAIGEAVAGLSGDRDVVLDIQVTRFHALTQKTRYTFGGEHELGFFLTVRDAATGDVIVPTYQVRHNFEAFGGQKAVRAEEAGLTQKVRITQELEKLILFELARPHDAPAADIAPA